MSIFNAIEAYVSTRLDSVILPNVTKQIVPATLESFREISDFLSWRVVESVAVGVDASQSQYTLLVQIFTSDRVLNNSIIDSVTRSLHLSTFKGSKFYRKSVNQVIRWERWLTEIEFTILLPTAIGLGDSIQPTTLTIGNIPVIYSSKA